MITTPSETWRDLGLLARVAEQDAQHAANQRVTATTSDVWAGEYARKLRDLKHVEAGIHAQAAETYEMAYIDACRAEKAGAA